MHDHHDVTLVILDTVLNFSCCSTTQLLNMVES